MIIKPARSLSKFPPGVTSKVLSRESSSTHGDEMSVHFGPVSNCDHIADMSRAEKVRFVEPDIMQSSAATYTNGITARAILNNALFIGMFCSFLLGRRYVSTMVLNFQARMPRTAIFTSILGMQKRNDAVTPLILLTKSIDAVVHRLSPGTKRQGMHGVTTHRRPERSLSAYAATASPYATGSFSIRASEIPAMGSFPQLE